MDYPIKVRIEIGPGYRGELDPMCSSDARKTLVKAFAKLVSLDDISKDQIFLATASHGLSTIHLTQVSSEHGDFKSVRFDEDMITEFENYNLIARLEQSPPGQN